MKRKYFWVLLFFLILGLALSLASLYASVLLYKNFSGQSLSSFASEGTVSLTVEAAPSAETSPEASTGGGGGGGSSGVFEIAEIFYVDPTEINVILSEGEQDGREIKVINTGGRTLDIDISVTGIENIVSADSNYLRIAPGEERSIILFINAPDEGGIFAGRIVFQSGDIIREVLVLINVRSGEALFDVSLTIPESFRVISPGENVRSFVSLLQIGPADQEVDVTVTYLIRDFEGNTLFTETETFFVLDSKDFVKEFITEGYLPGDYIAGIEVSYTEGLATSSAHFTIAEEKPAFDIPLIVLAILAVLVVAVIIFAILRYKKSARHPRKKK